MLVIDNLDEEAFPDFESLMARGLQGHVLVTSRVPVWEDAYLVEPMSSVVATCFLLGRTEQTDGRAAGEVAGILGGLPLALVQAAGYVKASGHDLANYAQLLRDRLGEMLTEGKPADYPHTVAATWQMSLERMGRHQPAGVALLRLCSFLAPNDIPISVLRGSLGEMPETLQEALADDIAMDRLIAELRRYALVERQGDGLRVHRLVQEVVCGGLSADEHRRWLAAVVEMLGAAYPQDVDNPGRWASCARLLPHVQPTTDLIGDRPIEARATSRMLDRARDYLRREQNMHLPGRSLSAR